MVSQDLEHAVLVGNSMGGGVALHFALRLPDQVDALVLVDAVGFGREGSMSLRLLSLPWIGEWMSPPSRKATIQLWEEIFWDRSMITDEWIDLSYEIWNQPRGDKVFLAALRSMANLWGVRREVTDQILSNLSKITVPTLVVWGQQDRVLPVAQAHVAVQGLPNARHHIFDPCGHCPQLECPEEFNALVLEFLTGEGLQV